MTTIDNQALYNCPENLLKGRTIVVTGAGDGIGRCAALTFAKYGATIVLVGKTTKKLESVYDEIEKLGYPQAAIYPLHLGGAVMKDYIDMRTSLENAFGHIDGILHNASVLGDRKPIAQTDSDEWLEVMHINVHAQFMMTQALLPLLEKSLDASIVFTSSSVGRKGRAYWGPYAVSKFATEGLMQTLADELANTSNIRVNAINPGATDTAMRRTAFPAENPTNNPQPIQIMPTYLYLMGIDSKGVNGQSLDAQTK
ncbi:MAG: NAD(P)-dependent dehydrogenase (short-subunit alcohol dehydrogenase family) [Oceanicoccus sp.]|jgi:NAD(P)-dependent dehydrogenase (short-subunit alcohol dehydrogenase family)